jgi:lipopolysaccharide biosynthesis regulator YciM
MKLVVLAAILTTCMFLSGPDDPGLTAARKARDLGDVKSLQTEITRAVKKAEETKSFDDYIRLAQLHNYMCEAAEASNNRPLVKEAAQAGVAAAEIAVRLNPNSSRAHQLLADLLGQLAPNVTGGGMKYGQRSTDEADKAIELDPKNGDAYVTRAISYLYTPEAFGGNKQKALEFFSKARNLDPQADSPHIWLALFHLEAGKMDEALREINEARQLNPGRKFAEFVFEQISANKKADK